MEYGPRLGPPAGVVDKLAKNVGRVLAGPGYLRDWVTKHGGEPMSMTQSDFVSFVQSESKSAAGLTQSRWNQAPIVDYVMIAMPPTQTMQRTAGRSDA